MIPIILDGSRLPLALAGRGPELGKRLAWLIEGGARRLTIYTDEPVEALGLLGGADGGPVLVPRLPDAAEISGARLLWVTGLNPVENARLARSARALGVLVNVEDVPSACDFHTPAVVRRGDLLLTVSTAGKSPGLAQRVRRWLEGQFGPEWEDRLALVAAKRQAWRRRPRSLAELAALTTATIDRKGWLGQAAAAESRP